MSINVRGGDSLSSILQRVGNAVKEIAKPAPAPQGASVGQSVQQQARVPGWDGTSSFETASAKGTSAAAPAPAASRPDLGRVLRDYQVQDDQTTKWSPKAGGLIPIPFTGEYTITQTEAKMLDGLSVSRGLVGLNTFNNIKDQAFEVSDRLYPNPSSTPGHVPADREREWMGNDGHRDAFRHAYWNALMTREFGAEWTQQFATAHEGLPGNPATREAMDLYNNEVGRQIAIANPNASPEELATLVQQAVTDGKMVVLDQSGQLQWSDRVPYGQHGLTDGVPAAGGQPVPNGDASARQY
ncbi:hypothetical protein [Myxococcus sp. RHSTA-1-4]|uniref:DUF6973 domain-containing protein n=1 Tax=Myxococcus sp. RHSTA-1-4 TaxID=2874601 RepID=UPI001CBF2449|nr:hypothetical protein [Myxococcus sp. RHSTA-1-4]MBZ4415963.1 hypothetical protein [Myxococcus sp. RHSTA-1-4]